MADTSGSINQEDLGKVFTELRGAIEQFNGKIKGKLGFFDATVTAPIKRGLATCELLYARNLTEEQIKEYNDNRPKEDNTEVDLIVDFYQRFIYRMEYMMKVGVEKGYNLISFMGP